MDPHPTIWVVMNHSGQIIHQSTDSTHVDLMRRYVEKSREVGDDWVLVEYSLGTILAGSDKQTKAALQGG